jgi:hypothetical protein
MYNYETQELVPDLEPDRSCYADSDEDFFNQMVHEKWLENHYGIKPEEDQHTDPTNPAHYTDIPKEYQHHRIMAIWGMDYHLSAAIKYLARSGKKQSAHLTAKEKEMEDLKKAITYISMRLELMEEGVL